MFLIDMFLIKIVYIVSLFRVICLSVSSIGAVEAVSLHINKCLSMFNEIGFDRLYPRIPIIIWTITIIVFRKTSLRMLRVKFRAGLFTADRISNLTSHATCSQYY